LKRLTPLLLLAALVAGPARAQDDGAKTPPPAPPAGETDPVAADYAKIDAVATKLRARPADEAVRNALLEELRTACGEFLDKHAAKASKDQLLPAAGMWFDLSLRRDDTIEAIKTRAAALKGLKDPPAELTDMLGKVDGALRAAEARAAIAPGKKAPNWTAQDIHTGAQVTLESLKGKVVLMDFWATWCPPCKALMAQELAPLHARYKDVAGFQLVGIGLPWRGDTPEKEKEFGEKNNYHWTKVFDPTAAAAEAYGINGIPFLCLVDGEGTILIAGTGGEVIGAIKDELAKRFGEAGKAEAPKADAPKSDGK